MSGIVDWLKDIANGIKEIYLDFLLWIKDIYDLLDDYFYEFVFILRDVKEYIFTTPTRINDAIKRIFIPHTDEIMSLFNAFVNDLQMKFGFNTDVFNNLFDGEMAVQDINGDYSISGVGTFRLKFLDTKFLYDGVSYFRPLIRGFMVLLMLFYNIKMILSFIRQDAGVVTGKVVEHGKGDKK